MTKVNARGTPLTCTVAELPEAERLVMARAEQGRWGPLVEKSLSNQTLCLRFANGWRQFINLVPA